MRRLCCLVVIWALAVVVVAAGPAFAAKGGNSENAHACQQGGFGHGFDAGTHKPFKNTGDCVNNGAKGDDSEFLFIDPSPYECPAPISGACWGTLEGQGLSPGEQWQVFFPADGPPPNGTTPFRTGTADDGGNIGATLNLPCGQGSSNAYAIAPDDNISDTSPSPVPCA